MNICWFTAGRDKEALALLSDVSDALEKEAQGARISLVLVDVGRDGPSGSAEIIAFAGQKGIPVESVSPEESLAGKGTEPGAGESFDAAVKANLQKYPCDLIFLGGCEPAVFLKLHDSYTFLYTRPSLPGVCGGMRDDVIRVAIEGGSRTFGATVYAASSRPDGDLPVAFVKRALEGAQVDVMYQNAFRGDGSSRDMLFRIMRWEQFSAETLLVIKTLALMSAGEIKVSGDGVLYRDVPVTEGLNVAELIEKKAVEG
jgi:folate-dependent phosphoribosylglycinamide formyltransferase PurN